MNSQTFFSMCVGMVFIILPSVGISAENNCVYLDILYPSYEYSLDKVKCHHGGFSIPTPGFIRMVQGPFYGPDCTIVAKKGNGASVVFRAQQNYCFLEAGDITVWIVDKSNAGGMNYSKREGSFGDSRPGEIGMNGFF